MRDQVLTEQRTTSSATMILSKTCRNKLFKTLNTKLQTTDKIAKLQRIINMQHSMKSWKKLKKEQKQ